MSVWTSMAGYLADRPRLITYDRAMRADPNQVQTRGRAAWSSPALLLLLLASPLIAGAAQHNSHRQNNAHRHEPQAAMQSEAGARCPGMSMDQAIENAERRYKARVVKASVDNGNDRCVYVLRLLSDDGRVWTVRVDSKSGA
jgi:uncharacterized membrane protein YkoI